LVRLFTREMGKKSRESKSSIEITSSNRQQDEIFEYLTKTFNNKDGPIQVDNDTFEYFGFFLEKYFFY